MDIHSSTNTNLLEKVKGRIFPQFQVRGKWTASKPPLKIDDIVIIKDECTAPTKWKLDKVIQIHPGNDGTVKVVTVRLASGAEMKRPTVKLCVLPIESENEKI